jgi:hypothetical protein
MKDQVEFRQGSTSPSTPARALAAYTANIDGLGMLTIAVLAPAGQAPRLQVGGIDGKPLSPGEWEQVRDAVFAVWGELKIRCQCRHKFGSHAMASPHACCIADCDCKVFSAAEPFFIPDEETQGGAA